MNDIVKIVRVAITLCLIIFLIFLAFFLLCPSFRIMLNKINYSIHKADDATNYKTLKKVEDTCRSMISSYESDKLTYEQYKDSHNEDKLEWAEQAKIRANKTASIYNSYILKNNYVWLYAVPSDIRLQLDYLE